MTNAVMARYEELILEAIDTLRHRKARPDAERIYNCLFRRHQISCNEGKLALEKCVESGVVLRVAYKGNISYRNAAKKFPHVKPMPLSHTQRQPHHVQLLDPTRPRLPGKPRRKFTALLTNAFAELIIQEPDYLELGVPPHKLIQNILAKDSVKYTKRYVSILLEKEVEAGGLIRMGNGNFLVGPNVNKTDRRHHLRQMDEVAATISAVSSVADNQLLLENQPHKTIILTSNKVTKHYKKRQALPKNTYVPTRYMENQTLRDEQKRSNESISRVGGRRKRAKKVFDPSDNYMPKRRGRPIGSLNNRTSTERNSSSNRNSDSDSRPDSRTSQNGRDQGGVCSVCHIQNKKGPNDKMVSCRECSNKAHSSCLNNGDDMMLKMYPDNTWQCPHCKTCVVCYETSDAGSLVVCSICADAYHLSCHQPKLLDKIKAGSKWICINCQMPEQLAVDDIQIGYSAKLNSQNDESRSHSPDLSVSRNTTPNNLFVSLPSSPTPPTLSPQPLLNGNRHSMTDSDSKSDYSAENQQSIRLDDVDVEENIDPSIPDASNWTCDEVSQYFSQYFPEESRVFKDQEINGRSLLLMKRMDVLKGLSLKLGIALKIYRHVLKLQYRRDDPKLYWA